MAAERPPDAVRPVPGRFNLFGIRWFTGCYGSVEEAEAGRRAMRRRLAGWWRRAGGRPVSAESRSSRSW